MGNNLWVPRSPTSKISIADLNQKLILRLIIQGRKLVNNVSGRYCSGCNVIYEFEPGCNPIKNFSA